MIPGGDQEQRGSLGTHAIQGQQARSAGGHEGNDQVVQALDLEVFRQVTPGTAGPVQVQDRVRDGPP